jgi:uncharacterized membrane protein
MSERARGAIAAIAVTALMSALTAATIQDTFTRYREFRTGWSWDLAYYHQWLWAATRGDGVITVRPISSYATEGPLIWSTNYLSPVRFALAGVYRIIPNADPRFLLVVQAVLFWCVIPAAYTLSRGEGATRDLALLAAVLVPCAPAMPTLAVNDFRELQIAMPFVLWLVQGWRSRTPWLFAAAAAALLCCRQEWAIAIASLAVVPALRAEPIDRSVRWRTAAILVGGSWILFAFFGFLTFAFGATVPDQYVQQFTGPKASLPQTLDTGFDFLWNTLGAWLIAALGAPIVGLLAIPWVWSQASGRLSLRDIGAAWHHIRYAAPFVAFGLAAGVIGWSRIAMSLRRRRRFLPWLLVAGAFVINIPPWVEFHRRIAIAPTPIGADEARQIWTAIEQVGSGDGVIAAYEVTAPLSGRRHLYSYVLDINKPSGYPNDLPSDIRWLFLERSRFGANDFQDQGFKVIYEGSFLRVLKR